MLFFSTDFPLSKELANEILDDVLEDSFNAISVDGDTSTNDAILLLYREGEYNRNRGIDSFKTIFRYIAKELALMIVNDGEGATKVIHLTVEGEDKILCKKIARNIANSILVKSAIAGGGINWGRIIASAGKNRTKIDITKISLEIGEHLIYHKEEIHSDNIPKANQYVQKNKDIDIKFSLSDKKTNKYVMHFSDLSLEYLTFNMELS